MKNKGREPIERKPKRKWVVIGTGSCGLWYGQIDDNAATRKKIIRDKACIVYGCRHVRYWHGGTGGITSLAAWGPNPANDGNRIGAPADSLITNIANVYDVPPEAQKRFAAVVPVKS
jgi:hypothetical protein